MNTPLTDKAECDMIIMMTEMRCKAVSSKLSRKLETALQQINNFKFTLFDDGVSADLRDEGITTIEEAYARGLSDACAELKHIASNALRTPSQ